MDHLNFVNNHNCIFRFVASKHFTAVRVCAHACMHEHMINVHTWILVFIFNLKSLLMKHLPVAKHNLHSSFLVDRACVCMLENQI